MTTTKIVTKASLQHMLDNRNRLYVMNVVGRALVTLFERQTDIEQGKNRTEEHNGIGFTGADARTGSITAKYYIKHKSLEDWQIGKWTKKSESGFSRLAKYHAQLNEVAVRKVS